MTPAADASRATEITSGIGRFDGEPAWTPDGKIVYASNASGNPDIWISDSDGRNAKQLTVDPGNDGAPAVSPDGRWVFYTSFAQPQRSVWKIPMTGGEAVRVFGPHTPPDDDPVRATLRATFVARAISRDGKVLAGSFLNREARGFRLGLVSVDSGEMVKKFDHGPFTSGFTPDGRTLTYGDTRNGVWNVWNQPIDGGAPKLVTSFASGSIFGFAWSRDGRQLAVARGTVTNDAVLISNLTPLSH